MVDGWSPVVIGVNALVTIAIGAMGAWAGPASGKVEVGFGCGPAARMSEQDLARMESLLRQDLLDREEGRYRQMQDDGVSGYWGLEAIRARQEATGKPARRPATRPAGKPAGKPYADLQRGEFFQTERVIFADLGTGARLMKLTDEPCGSGDELNYFGKSCFNADGSLMTWQRSRRPAIWGPIPQASTATHGPVVMRSDGTHLRVVQGEWPRRLRPPVVCHPLDPDLGYAMDGDRLLELDLRREQVRRVVASGMPGWWLKISPDGRYACDADYARGPITVVSLETGEKWVMKLSGQIHDSYRFLPADTDWIMYWYEKDPDRHRFHMMNFKTGEDRAFDFRYDWNHGDMGVSVGVHESGRLYTFDGRMWHADGNAWWPEQTFSDEPAFYNIPADYNGYCQYWPDDQLWAYGTLITERPYLSEIMCWFAKPLPSGRANRFRICYTNLGRDTDSDRKGEKTVTLDRPNISPDGTKLLFNSNVFGAAEVYLVVLRNPLPPIDVCAGWTGSGVKVTWQAPKQAREIAGYLVYRSEESGHGFEALFEEPMAGREFVDSSAEAGRAYFYAVRAVEHSRVESPLSAEAGAASDPKVAAEAPRRVFVEAEEAIACGLEAASPDCLWMNFDGLASNLYYIWQRRPDQAGTAKVAVTLPRADEYYVYARMKGKEGAEFTVAGQEVSLSAAGRWTWARSAEVVRLEAGPQEVAISSSKYGSCLDCLYLSTDPDFAPKGRIRAVVPSAPRLTAVAESRGVRLTWSGEKSPRWSHYNLYSSDGVGFTCDRATLIASPDESEHLDWAAPAGRKYYKVTQVTLDGLESAPSGEVMVE